ncbi:MAG TPA: hypothetical protein VFF65_04210, partial [Phycisphaerales bacterium]|nr:hypothetical protein [Phycisphaerales bacterium]
MRLKTFRAPTMADALSQVKKDLGKDAVILHTRSYKAGAIFGLGGKPTVEITASVDVNTPARGGTGGSRARSEQPEPAPAPPGSRINPTALGKAYGLARPLASPLPGGEGPGVGF